jgi:preprotein translocase subunit SecG
MTPGGSSTHLHKNSTQNIEDGTHITIMKKKNWVVIKIWVVICLVFVISCVIIPINC